ncbi:MAG: pitrilysin family protein [candidate division Zixibacteria bacterium]|nr:pitrilysin family protein [candidate division Zixibacteria bacterium]
MARIVRQDATIYNKTTLRNGLRVVSEHLPGVRSISLGIWLNVGSRCEQIDENGFCHFLEHLAFKGTSHRNARQIAESLESLGGSLNAFTTREQTCFTARILDEHLAQAVDVLADLACHPTLTSVNVNRERQVVCEEIRESLDNPADFIHDLFSDTHWGGHPLGRPIMGTEKIIKAAPRARLKQFREQHYRNGSVVVAASGAISHKRLVELVRAGIELPDGSAPAPALATRQPEVHRCFQTDDNSQTQFCIGFPGLPYGHRDRMAVVLLSSYLGGGMSSVLFQKIREDRGLAYAVASYHDSYSDAGVFEVSLGTDRKHLRQAFDLILAECRRLKKRPLDSTAIKAIKAQIRGHMMLAMESTSARMNRLGRQELLLGRYQTLTETLDEIDRTKSHDLLRVANLLFDESQITLTALGPADPSEFKGLG